MHEIIFKIDFFAIFRKLQKKLPICKKKYAKILNVARAVVARVEKNQKRSNRKKSGLKFWEQTVTKIPKSTSPKFPKVAHKSFQKTKISNFSLELQEITGSLYQDAERD